MTVCDFFGELFNMGRQINPPGMHIVRQGEWISKLAKWYGIPDWKTIWNHGNNTALRNKRKNQNIIYPGDEVFIPAIEPKNESLATENLHRFVLSGKKIKFQMVVYDEDKTPRKDIPYKFTLQGIDPKEGMTDGNGKIIEEIPADAEQAYLEIDNQVIKVCFGELDPIETISGIQARLKNLGYDPGEIDGIDGPKTQNAVRAFQKECPPLKVDGICGSQTRSKLKEIYGC